MGKDALETLDVWKKACRLSVDIYRLMKDCPDRGFKDQVTRSALSVPSNIAEGYERNSRAELVRFFRIAKGSCGELRTQMLLVWKSGLFHRKPANMWIRQ
ncbi:MAG: hypothetical protein QG652_40 [Pseudomonadota bacterium]|nr:hypothetical protein [Pseudomonadota bacterium]